MSVQKAAGDMKYLLTRNYNRNTALNLVVNHYHLTQEERNHLQRYVFSEHEIKSHRSKIIPVDEIRGERVVVDGYNVLITVESILNGDEVVEGMDGVLRDLSCVFSSYRFNLESRRSVAEVLKVFLRYKPGYVLFIFDSQISRSGELSHYLTEEMQALGIPGDSRTSRTADRDIIDLCRVTASSDSVIIEGVDKVVDLPRVIMLSR